MQFETEEPSHRAFPSLGYAFENFVNMYSLVLTDTQWCAVNEAYTRAFSNRTFLINKVKGTAKSLSNSTIRL